MDKEINRWVVTINNNDVDGIDMQYVKGTKEQVIDYIKRLCFEYMNNGDKAEYVSFGEVNNDISYRCSVQFSTYHIEISANVEQKNYVSLEELPLEFSRYSDNGGMDSEETEIWYFKQEVPSDLKDYGLTEEEIKEIIDSDYIEDIFLIFENGYYLDVFDSFSECGANNVNNPKRKECYTNEEFANFLCLNYEKEIANYKEFCVKLSTGRIIQIRA